MGIDDLRIVTTVLLFFLFMGIVWWAFGKGRKQYFDDAAAIPFGEKDEPGGVAEATALAEKRKES